MYEDFDLSDFWTKGSPDEEEEFVEEPVTDEMVAEVERTLKYKLPAAYVALSKVQNGGIPKRSCFRTTTATSWAPDHIMLTGIFSIGRTKRSSLCGDLGSQFWIDEWGYPAIGIYFADCPSAGHDMVCLDYGACGPDGEPRVVHIDQESDYKVTVLAPNFEAFIRGLEDEDAFES